MKKLNVGLLSVCLILSLAITGCYADTQSDAENKQQSLIVSAITENQKIPDLGGYSFERQIVIETVLARNNTVSTYTYQITMTGFIIEICPSVGYPIPYSTQLTNPQIPTRLKVDSAEGGVYFLEGVVANPEVTGLYPPVSADATWIQCANSDGSVTPVYYEEKVEAFPFRIQSNVQLVRLGEPSYTIVPEK